MKANKILLLLMLLFCSLSFGQVGIGTISPSSSAILDLTASNKALLLTRVASTAAIASPVNGMLIYDISSNCFKAYSNGAWTDCLSGRSGVSARATNNGTLAEERDTSDLSSIVTYKNGESLVQSRQIAVSAEVTKASETLSTVKDNPSSETFTTFDSTEATNNDSDNKLKQKTAIKCGAYITAGVWKEFMCHNLGADTSLDPNIPVQGIQGNYYQWGRSDILATAYTSASAIANFNTTNPATGSWSDTSKTTNDPCPIGYRIPTADQWTGVIANNIITRTGTWTSSSTNFGTAIYLGPDTNTKTLTLPVAGLRSTTNGALQNRGKQGYYWTSSERAGYGTFFQITASIVNVVDNTYSAGQSLRCIKE